MATSANGADEAHANWGSSDDNAMGSRRSGELDNETLPGDDRGQDPNDQVDYTRGASVGNVSLNKGDHYRGKEVKPNKVYIGGLPEHTRTEDLHRCFGQIGNIINIELKYVFSEFDTSQAAEEGVAKYHEGHFMGNKIRVELSRGGGRTAKYAGAPGACFKCGNMGHWARGCPNAQRPHRRNDAPMNRDREYLPAPPPPRDSRYDYPPRDNRSTSPPRDYRDYLAPPSMSRGRDYDDYRRGPVSERDHYAPSAAVPYDRYERRPHEMYSPPGRARSRPRTRDDYDREPAPRTEPLRATERYPRGTAEMAAPRYRRRSESPPPSRSSDGPYE
ncbi:hypothetical protein R3P38DRAFT_3312158 [Favolaschia claudopus]|uniref:RNA-binding domain-containing protein n=1 Tax=Favolaschia claudopus TaxID=2862362 RepID=A0AAW0C570_9AGAR